MVGYRKSQRPGVGPTCSNMSRNVWETNGDVNKDVWIMVEMPFFMGLMTSVGVNRCSLLPRGAPGPSAPGPGLLGPSSPGGRA